MKVMFSQNQATSLMWCFLAICAVMLMPVEVLAQDGGGGGSEPTALANVLCDVVGWFTGRVGTGIATLAIIVIGIGALMGKVSWGMAMIVGLGVAVIFGAPTIVSSLNGNAGAECSTTAST